MPDTSPPDDFDTVILQIGEKGNLSAEDCKKMAASFRLARIRYPAAKIMFTVGGYDDDPREIYDIPEVREYILRWAIDADLTDWRDAIKIPWLENCGLGILQLCGVFGPDSPITVNTPAGVRR